eukprot:TRINITY_DN3237_c0_g2_i1.p1 TRINITY_DN3237_c0_g2~~TRINITY_DN3237_c0_g2_i1.p1  ORF type:complete len:109 (+),score=24.74 TRINITY_DN3237_c0_g2_i1:342-668(+)
MSTSIPIIAKDKDVTISQSLGGTFYGTTPGGSRFVYDRNSLLQMRNSPLSKTPPPIMAHIPGITLVQQQGSPSSVHTTPSSSSPAKTSKPSGKAKSKGEEDDNMFEME